MKQQVQWPIVCRDGDIRYVGRVPDEEWLAGLQSLRRRHFPRAEVIFDDALTLCFPRNQSINLSNNQKMLELSFVQENLLKKVLEALKYLVTDANFIVQLLDFLSKPWIEVMD